MKHIDVTDSPELLHLAEEVSQTREPRMLRRGNQELALLLPIGVPQTSDEDIWANYDPEKVRRALRETAGILVGVDIPQLLDDLRAEREQSSIGRPS